MNKPQLPSPPEEVAKRAYQPSGRCPPQALLLILGGIPGTILIAFVGFSLSKALLVPTTIRAMHGVELLGELLAAGIFLILNTPIPFLM